MKTSRIFYGVLAVTAVTSLCFCQKHHLRPPSAVTPPLHGTVNIILGNRNGLVAITDSRLTSNKGDAAPFPAQKLFRLDDRTICTVAGFYIYSGPELGKEAYPAFTIVSDIIDRYVSSHSTFSHDALETKVRSLTSLFQFSLNLVTNMELASLRHKGVPSVNMAPSDSVLTVAGYENGRIRVIQVHLLPTLRDGQIEFTAMPVSQHGICVNDFTVNRSFECAMAGLYGPAEKVLDANDPVSSRVEIVGRFLKAKKDGKLGDLSVEEMKELAEYLEKRCEEDNRVGPPTQIAVLKDGSAIVSPMQATPPTFPKPIKFNVYDGSPFQGTMPHPGIPFPIEGGMSASPELGALVANSEIDDVIQPLDNIIFVKSTFDRCTLTYNGSPMAIFDATNVIRACRLIVAPHVDMTSAFLSQLRVDYPDLQISQGAVPRTSRWQILQGNSSDQKADGQH